MQSIGICIFFIDSVTRPPIIPPRNGTEMWMVSSVGRAPPLQGGGHWFKPSTIHHRRAFKSVLYGWLAQLGEHRPYKAGVTGSSPVPSTTFCLSSQFSFFNSQFQNQICTSQALNFISQSSTPFYPAVDRPATADIYAICVTSTNTTRSTPKLKLTPL